MNDSKSRVIDLSIEVPASVEQVWQALTSGQGIANWFAPYSQAQQGMGAKVHLSWGEYCEWDTYVTAWEPLQHVQWKDHPGDVVDAEGGNTRGDSGAAIDFYLQRVDGGTTRVRLVQSGFGAGGEFDEYFNSVTAGWTFFLSAMQHYFHYHLGKTRQMFSLTPKFTGSRGETWQKVLFAAGGLLSAPDTALDLGVQVELELGRDNLVCGIVTALAPERTVAFRMPEQGDALLFIEIEPGERDNTCGFWLSTYGEKAPAELTASLENKVNALLAS